ncbi:MAG: hypothetical protein BWY45_02594 [Euryarchaeota archaeon ADurb.Bin294]|jgi:hypothetical protein|nr:MAG: hypothetical protein BWY45_02594 [Euryarchaeota archaeon ADurb.Bin294]
MFTVISVKDTFRVRYEKAGRLIPGDNDTIRKMLDGTGEIGVIPMADIFLPFGGIAPDGLTLSESGDRIILTGQTGEEYVVLTRQVRGMILDWPRKKAALFAVREGVRDNEKWDNSLTKTHENYEKGQSV